MYLFQLRDLELELCGAVLRVLKFGLETLCTVVALDLLLEFAHSSLILLGLTPQLAEGCIHFM